MKDFVTSIAFNEEHLCGQKFLRDLAAPVDMTAERQTIVKAGIETPLAKHRRQFLGSSFRKSETERRFLPRPKNSQAGYGGRVSPH